MDNVVIGKGSISGNGVYANKDFKKGEIVYPLRFMSGNPNTSKKDLHDMIEYVQTLGNELLLK